MICPLDCYMLSSHSHALITEVLIFSTVDDHIQHLFALLMLSFNDLSLKKTVQNGLHLLDRKQSSISLVHLTQSILSQWFLSHLQWSS